MIQRCKEKPCPSQCLSVHCSRNRPTEKEHRHPKPCCDGGEQPTDTSSVRSSHKQNQDHRPTHLVSPWKIVGHLSFSHLLFSSFSAGTDSFSSPRPKLLSHVTPLPSPSPHTRSPVRSAESSRSMTGQATAGPPSSPQDHHVRHRDPRDVGLKWPVSVVGTHID